MPVLLRQAESRRVEKYAFCHRSFNFSSVFSFEQDPEWKRGNDQAWRCPFTRAPYVAKSFLELLFDEDIKKFLFLALPLIVVSIFAIHLNASFTMDAHAFLSRCGLGKSEIATPPSHKEHRKTRRKASAFQAAHPGIMTAPTSASGAWSAPQGSWKPADPTSSDSRICSKRCSCVMADRNGIPLIQRHAPLPDQVIGSRLEENPRDREPANGARKSPDFAVGGPSSSPVP